MLFSLVLIKLTENGQVFVHTSIIFLSKGNKGADRHFFVPKASTVLIQQCFLLGHQNEGWFMFFLYAYLSFQACNILWNSHSFLQTALLLDVCFLKSPLRFASVS